MMDSMHIWYMILGGWGCSYLLRIIPFLFRNNTSTVSRSWHNFMEIAAFAVMGGIISSTALGSLKLWTDGSGAWATALSHLAILVLTGAWFVWRGALIEALILGLGLTAVAEAVLGVTG